MSTLRVVLLLPLAWGISAACWKHASCDECIVEIFHGGSCLWYENPNAGHSAAWSCVAGMVGPSRKIEEEAKLVGSSRWSYAAEDGSSADFTVLHVDTLSDDSCFWQQCGIGATCPLGFYAVANQPCYPNGVHPDWRHVRCCKQQRNTDGFLRGINETGGIVQGRMFFSMCCRRCPPGHVNIGCDSYSTGNCELCPAGYFNPSVEAGSTCSKCMPCPAGQQRVNCGPSSPGRCEDCEPGRFKVQGLEGDALDECAVCPGTRCPGAAVRIGCGLADPGHCERCPQGTWFAQPYCRDCNTCGSRRDYGCGGRADSTCSRCSRGKYEAQDGSCKQCAPCPDQVDPLLGSSLNMTGPMVRIGCGASAPGECVRLGASLASAQSGTQCSMEQLPEALCPGALLQLNWGIEGLGDKAPQLATGSSDCAAADGVCLTGRWQAALWQRTAEHVAGVEVQKLGEWPFDDPDEVNTIAVSDVNSTRHLFYIKNANLQALLNDLDGGRGYFVRLAFIDWGKTCCAGSDSSPLFVDTADFDVGSNAAAVETSLREAEIALIDAEWQQAHSILQSACAAQDGTEACERARALQLGVNTDLALRPLQTLPPVIIAPALQAKQAALPVDEVQGVFATWEGLRTTVFSFQSNFSGWITEESVAMSNASHDTSNMSTIEFSKLEEIAKDVCNAANMTMTLWQAEVDDSLQHLSRVLSDLKDMDSQLDTVAWNIGFDVVRMTQAMTKSLRTSVAGGPPAEESARITWYATAVHGIGNIALMMLGTWRGDWRHTLPWRLAFEMGMAEPETFSNFGGVEADPGRVLMSDARGRVWQPFRRVADALLSRLAADIAEASNSSTHLRRVAADGDDGASTLHRVGAALEDSTVSRRTQTMELQDLAGVIDEITGFMDFIQNVTEKLMDPLSQAGSRWLAGQLPDISGCGPKLRCISTYISTLNHQLAVDIALQGLGPRAYRPWIDPNIDAIRQRRAATEMVSLIQGRALLFEGALLQMLDVRYIWSEPRSLIRSAKRANSAALQFDILGGEAANTSLDTSNTQVSWRWRYGWSELQDALSTSWRTVTHLARRKLGQFEQLVAFTSPSGEGSVQSWRVPWSPATAENLHVSKSAAVAELEGLLSEKWGRRGQTAFLRIEANEETWPVALSSLANSGETLLRLEAPPGMHGVLMHAEAHAFLISKPIYGALALQVVESDESAPAPVRPANLTVTEPHIELRLRHVGRGYGELLHNKEPFVSRHKRSRCAALDSGASASIEGYSDADGALLPLYGTWLLSARDGTSLQQLQFDEGTFLRLLIKVDVPRGRPPWELVHNIHDALYQMPAGDDCDSLEPLFGYQAQEDPNPTVTTTITESSMMIRTVQPVGGSTPSQGSSEPEADPDVVVPKTPRGGFMTTQAPREDSSEAWKSFLWTIPVIVLASICLCCMLVYARCRDKILGYVHRKMPWLIKPRKKNLVMASDPTFDSPSPKGAESLRHRLPSPKTHETGSPPGAPPMPGQLNMLRASAARAEVPVPKEWIVEGRSMARGRRRGGRGSSKGDESDAESWGDDAATPPGSSERSSSSSSSRSYTSSGSSECSLEPAHPLGPQQSTSQACRNKMEDAKALQGTGLGGAAGNIDPQIRAAGDTNSASCSNSTGTPRGTRADPAELPPAGSAEGNVHQAAAAAEAQPPTLESTDLENGRPPADSIPELLT